MRTLRRWIVVLCGACVVLSTSFGLAGCLYGVDGSLVGKKKDAGAETTSDARTE